ncbi:MAG: tRNA (N(6)-L-threonylcarbamoyladenosine(37)-C(2))-methylthiotransferase MtaB [Bacteroidales bacterium]|nr:tRNA (N(6)-L-threonylcarbamoyladenosine(37)-C(2))-methylthiotransferase MtaB [Bacteroidales bacterium]
MAKNIAYVTLGCKLNYAETSTYERALTEAGCSATSWTSGKADVCLVNTCSVTEHSDKKCRNIIRKLHRVSPDADIVVTGCYAQLKKDEILELEGVKAVFGANEKNKVVPFILGECSQEKSPCMFSAYSSGERTRSFLKVQDGCNNYCTYCTVPYARGESRNIPIAEVIPQAREIAAKGICEIVLTGVNTGDFGRSTGESFFDLIKELNKVEGIERYRISSIEPNLLTDEMVDWIAAGSKFLPHFHIPLQSGCDAVLSEMHRHYDTEFFARKIEYIRKAMEGPGRLPVFFGIDVIVGFPGETEEMFEQTYRFLAERVKPAFIHIFPYSRRAGTPAAERKDQVRDGIKTERVERLEALCDKLHGEFVESCKGLKAKVLFESSDKKGMMYGYTENYIQVARPYDRNLVGRISEVEI